MPGDRHAGHVCVCTTYATTNHVAIVCVIITISTTIITVQFQRCVKRSRDLSNMAQALQALN